MILNTGLKSRNSSCAPMSLQVSKGQLLHHESPQILSRVVGSGVAHFPALYLVQMVLWKKSVGFFTGSMLC